MTSKERAYLRSLASGYPTIMQIGKSGLTDNLVKTVSDALEARELIKLGVLDNSLCSPKEVAEALAEATNAQVVAIVGKKIILYRLSQKEQKIVFP